MNKHYFERFGQSTTLVLLVIVCLPRVFSIDFQVLCGHYKPLWPISKVDIRGFFCWYLWKRNTGMRGDFPQW